MQKEYFNTYLRIVVSLHLVIYTYYIKADNYVSNVCLLPAIVSPSSESKYSFQYIHSHVRRWQIDGFHLITVPLTPWMLTTTLECWPCHWHPEWWPRYWHPVCCRCHWSTPWILAVPLTPQMLAALLTPRILPRVTDATTVGRATDAPINVGQYCHLRGVIRYCFIMNRQANRIIANFLSYTHWSMVCQHSTSSRFP